MTVGPISEETVSRAKTIGVRAKGILRERLDTVGDGSGTKEMATTADEYLILPPEEDVYLVDNIQFVLQDTGGSFPWDEFGALGSALSSGILIDNVVNETGGIRSQVDFLDNKPIKQNAHFLPLGIVSTSLSSSGISILTCKIDFKSLIGVPILLRGSRDDGFRVTIQDDLSGLDSLEVWASGLIGS